MLTKRLATTAACVLAATALSSGVAVAQNARAPRVVVLGDSLSSGHGIGAAVAFPAVLQERIATAGLGYQVVNAGISGDTSAGALNRVRSALAGDVRVLVVAIGGNDGLRGLPVANVKSNVSRIIQTAHARGVSVVLCGMEAPPIHGVVYTTAFHNVFPELAARYQVMLVPFLLQNVITDPAMLLPDRVHPNAAGARRIADNVWPYLEPVLRALAAQP